MSQWHASQWRKQLEFPGDARCQNMRLNVSTAGSRNARAARAPGLLRHVPCRTPREAPSLSNPELTSRCLTERQKQFSGRARSRAEVTSFFGMTHLSDITNRTSELLLWRYSKRLDSKSHS